MTMIHITCPHCGFGKEVPSERIPATALTITCPQCKQQFEFIKAATDTCAKTLQTPQARLAESVPLVAAGTPAVETITCPECGYSKKLPAGTVPSGTCVTCPRCRQRFIFQATGASSSLQPPQSEGVTPPPSPPQTTVPPRTRRELSSIRELFAKSWDGYRQKIVTLISLFMLALLPQIILSATLYLLYQTLPQPPAKDPLFLLVAIPVLLIVIIPLIWMGGASIFVIAGACDGLRDAIRKARPKIGSFAWLALVSGFIICGGYLLFFIPGLIFTTWFLFAPFVLVLDDRRGMRALLSSKAFVSGNLGSVLWRYSPAWLISLLIGLIPLVGPFLSLAFAPFLLIYACELFRDLREMKGEVRFVDTTLEKCKWLGAATLGYIVIPIIAMAFMGTMLFSLIPTVSSLFQVGGSPTIQLPAAPMLASLATEEEDPVPVELGEAEYDALLASERVSFEDSTGVSVGPAALLIDQFWADKKSPHIWLKLRLPLLPNAVLVGRQLVRVAITHVGSSNTDSYDPDSGFETEFFQHVTLSAHDTPSRYLGGARDIHLIGGTNEKDADRVTGELILHLPLQVASAKLDAAEIDKEVAIAGRTITLKKLADKQVTLDYRGDTTNFLRIVGYGADGKPVAKGWDSWNTIGDVTSLQQSFAGDISSVKVFVATRMIERKYQFDIKK